MVLKVLTRLAAAATTILAIQLAPAQLSAGGVTSNGGLSVRESGASRAAPMIIGSKSNMVVAVRTDGTVVQWGYPPVNTYTFPAGTTDAKALKVGSTHFLLQKSDGTITAWGQNLSGELNVPAGLGPVLSFSAGGNFSCAVKSDGTVACWGSNTNGQLNVPAGLSNVVQVASGGSFTTALKSDGTVVCWGLNNLGQCNVPAGLTGVVQIEVGGAHSMALKSDGTVVCWGLNTSGQCNVPAGLSGVTQLSASSNYSLALKSDGKVVSWGTGSGSSVPAGLSGVTQISAGGNYAFALTADRTIVRWGSLAQSIVQPPAIRPGTIQAAGGSACLYLNADGTVASWGESGSILSVPAYVTNVVKVCQGSNNFAAALKADGSVVCWGSGAPATITNLADIVDIASGANFVTALKRDGTVVIVGPGGTVPDGLSDVIQVAAGSGHSLALKSDGTIVAWGSNSNGQTDIPAGLTGVVAIAARGNHSLALRSNGTVAAWGSNSTGESSVSPSSTSGSLQIAAGDNFSVALRSNGQLAIWGGNSFGGTTNSTLNIPGISRADAGVTAFYFRNVSVSLDAPTLVANGTVTGMVVLPVAPGEGGADVALQTNTATFAVPATVHVDEGSHFATFTATSYGFTDDSVAQVIATYGQTTTYASITLSNSPNHISRVVLSNQSVSGSNAGSVTGTVFTSGAVTGDTTVNLVSSDPSAASAPTSVTILAGHNCAQFSVPYGAASVDSSIIISATLNGEQVTTRLDIGAPKISSIAFDSPSINSGYGVGGTVYLTAPTSKDLTVTLTSSDSALASPTATVVVPAGSSSATFAVATQLSGVDHTVTITAQANGVNKSAPLQLVALRIQSVVFTPSTARGGAEGNGTITLSYVLPSDATIDLVTDSPSLIHVASSTNAFAGYDSTSFQYNAAPVVANTTVSLGASFGGGDATSGTLTITPPTVSAITISPSTYGVQRVTGTVTLNGPATEGFTVPITTNSTFLSGVTATFTAGSYTADFTVTSGDTPKAITVRVNAGDQHAAIAIKPNLVKSITIAPGTVIGGSSQTVSGTVTLTVPPCMPVNIQMVAADMSGATYVNPTLVVSESGTATFTVDHQVVPTFVASAISANRCGQGKVAGLVLLPNIMKSFSVTPTSFVGGSTTPVVGAITLTSVVGRDTTYNVQSSDNSVTVSGTVTVLAGQKSASFTIYHHGVASLTNAQITVTRSSDTLTKVLTVRPNPLASHTISPSTVVGNSADVVTGTVTLSAPVWEDTTVTLSCVNAYGTTFPATVTVPAGQNGGSYNIGHVAVTKTKTVSIVATKMAVAKKATLTVNP